MILGIGVDTVDIARFERALVRTPRLRERLFTSGERNLSPASLAARFAAKEAFIKAMGGSGSATWHQMEIVSDASRAPSLHLTGEAAALAERRGVTNLKVSLAHDGGHAVAFVIAEGEGA